MAGKFLNNVPLIRTFPWEVGHDPKRPWLLLDSLKFDSEVAKATIIVPAGYRTDFASVPRVCWRIYPKDGPWSLGAIVHDWLCDTKPVSHTVAADVFEEAIVALQVPKHAQIFMPKAVRWFGPRWK